MRVLFLILLILAAAGIGLYRLNDNQQVKDELRRRQVDWTVRALGRSTGATLGKLGDQLEDLSEHLASGDSDLEQRTAIAVATLSANLKHSANSSEERTAEMAGAIQTAAVSLRAQLRPKQ